jgi:hypothetical protein
MAHVYLAVQESVDRKVALKVMSPVLLVDPSFSARFIREARIAANLNHKGVVSVYDVGLYEDHNYIAMEYMAGGDLASHCSRGIDAASALRVIREIASALDYAHSRGFVHRDVKPENILFREDDSAVLTDFGIARAVDSATQMTRTGAVIGTPQYMSPEQARGQDLDGRSDIYGLGIVLYEILTGKVPYEGADSVSVGIKHVTAPVPKLPEHMATIQPLLNGMLAKQPEERYQTGGEVVTAIERIEQGQQVGESSMSETVAMPVPQDATRVSDAGQLAAAAAAAARPEPGPQKGMNISATPRPDGTLRQEPTLGSIDEIKSYDRTLSQPTVPAGKNRAGPVLLITVLLTVLVAAGWWQRDRLMSLIPMDPGVIDILERAVAAEASGRYYGQGDQYASTLFEQAKQQDPNNLAARAGLDRVATYLVERARQAEIDGNAQQANLLLEKARELSPSIAAAAILSPTTSPPEPVIPDPAPAEITPAVDPRAEQLTSLLAEAMDLLRRDQLVGEGQDNAVARFRQMLEIEPGNQAARAGLDRIAGDLRAGINDALRDENLAKADGLIQDLERVIDDAVELAGYRQAFDRLQEQVTQRERVAEQRRNRISGLIQMAESALAADRLGTPESDNAIGHFRAVLGLDAENARARDGLSRVAKRYLALTELALEDDRLQQAAAYIAAIDSLQPTLPGLDRARRRLALYSEQRQRNTLTPEQEGQAQVLVLQARTAFERDELLAPPGQSAYDLYKAALRLNPGQAEAISGLRQVSVALVERSRNSLRGGDMELAYSWLGDARETDPQNPLLTALISELGSGLRRAALRAIDESRLDEAESLLAKASDLEPEHPDLAQLQLRLNIARE